MPFCTTFIFIYDKKCSLFLELKITNDPNLKFEMYFFFPPSLHEGKLYLSLVSYSSIHLGRVHMIVVLLYRPYELILVDHGGSLRSYYVSPSDGVLEFHRYSFSKAGVSSVCWDNFHNLLLVASTPQHTHLDLKVCCSAKRLEI